MAIRILLYENYHTTCAGIRQLSEATEFSDLIGKSTEEFKKLFVTLHLLVLLEKKYCRGVQSNDRYTTPYKPIKNLLCKADILQFFRVPQIFLFCNLLFFHF